MKKKFDPFDAVMEHGKLSIGTVGVVGIAGKTAQHLPSSTGSSIVKGMDTLKIVPTLHGASIGLESLRMLERKARRR